MGEKNKKNGEGKGEKNNNNNNSKDKGGGGGGGGKNNVTVVLKADLHCEGCATKVIKCIRSFDGVENAAIGEGQKITVVGKVDPVKLRDKVEQKTHKKIELISPLPKKEDNNNDAKENKQQESKKDKPKKDQLPVTTAVMKVNLHCEGCIQQIHKIVTKSKGYEDMKIDKHKDLVTVTGAIDMKGLADVIKKHLKRNVEILPPPKKEGADKKDNAAAGGKPDKKKTATADGEKNMEPGNKMQMQFHVGYPYPFLYGPGHPGDHFHYNPYPIGPYHAPQMFSDENPNACSIM